MQGFKYIRYNNPSALKSMEGFHFYIQPKRLISILHNYFQLR